MMLAAGLSLIAVVSAAAPSPAPSSWAEIRGAVGEVICARLHGLPDGRERVSVVAGSRKLCALAPAADPLRRAVDKACDQAQLLIAAIHPDGLSAAHEAGLAPDERTRRAREAYLTSEEFLRAVLPRLREAMKADGLACSDCPEFSQRPVRKVTWDEFAPYLAAYVWPDPVETPLDASGKPSGMPKYSFHVCGGLNGIGEMKEADPLLVRAAFVATFRNDEFLQFAGEHFQETLNEHAFQTLDDDAARTRYLRSRMPLLTVNDPAARGAVCRAVDAFKADLGFEISDCGGAPTATLDGH